MDDAAISRLGGPESETLSTKLFPVLPKLTGWLQEDSPRLGCVCPSEAVEGPGGKTPGGGFPFASMTPNADDVDALEQSVRSLLRSIEKHKKSSASGARGSSSSQAMSPPAATTAAVVRHAPALLRTGPEHLANAAAALRGSSRHADGDYEYESEEDDDVVYLADGTTMRLGEHLDQVRR